MDKNAITHNVAIRKSREKLLKENTGSDKGKLVPRYWNDYGFLGKEFRNILDYNFTAKVEQDFDEIAEGNLVWSKMMQEFYDQFHPNVKDVEANAERESGQILKLENRFQFV
jgi:DNA topoisomerase-1